MNIEPLKKAKKDQKMTYEQLSEKSGVPLSTIYDLFRGVTAAPRIDTVQAIERALGLSSTFTEEDYANGVTDKARIEVNTRQYEWLELGDEVIRVKGEDFYKTLITMIEAIIGQKNN